MLLTPKEMLLSFFIGTFLTNFDAMFRKLNTCYYTPVYKNETGISQWRLLTHIVGIEEIRVLEMITYFYIFIDCFRFKC